jgi:hypothetical protein
LEADKIKQYIKSVEDAINELNNAVNKESECKSSLVSAKNKLNGGLGGSCGENMYKAIADVISQTESTMYSLKDNISRLRNIKQDYERDYNTAKQSK